MELKAAKLNVHGGILQDQFGTTLIAGNTELA
jgi:hypothetical protein